jgi:hypothetical protein
LEIIRLVELLGPVILRIGRNLFLNGIKTAVRAP